MNHIDYLLCPRVVFVLIILINFKKITAFRLSSRSPTAVSSVDQRPEIVVFDLDACVWLPEMYQLWGGGGAPFQYRSTDNSCIDAAGTRVFLLGAIPEVLHEEICQVVCVPTKLVAHTQVVEEAVGWGARLAIASRTDEPLWAREILGMFKTAKGATLIDLFDPTLIEMCELFQLCVMPY